MYSEIKINGYCDVNYIWSKKDTITEDELNNIIQCGLDTPKWDKYTITLSTFENNLYASDLSLNDKITGFLIQRQDVNENVRKKITIADSYYSKIEDFCCRNNSTFKYYIIPIVVDDNGIQYSVSPIVTDNVSTNYNTCSIVGLLPTDTENEYIVDKDNIWCFGLNVKIEKFSPTFNKAVHQNLKRYPKIVSNSTNYINGSVSCYLGDINCSDTKYINDDIKLINKWVDFCNNGCIKLFKDRKGHVIPCDIVDTSYECNDNVKDAPTTISFNFTQVFNADDISVFRLKE